MLYFISMKVVRGVFLYALCFSFLFGLSISSAEAAYSRASKTDTTLVVSPPDQKILDATVNLYCRIEVGNKKFSTTGSGVVIDSRGVILTNAHVAQYFLLNGDDSKLKSDCSVRNGSPAKEAYSAEVLYISKSWLAANVTKSPKKSSKGTGEYDFALLYVTDAKKGTAPAQFSVIPAQTLAQFSEEGVVTVAGYPAGGLSFSEIRNKLKASTASSTITSVRAFGSHTADLIALSPSKIASSGVSGGPVVHSGGVVGIATAMSTSGSGKKKESSLRAITLPYINRTVQLETGMPLSTLYAGDLSVRAELTQASLSPEVLKAIEKPLRVTR